MKNFALSWRNLWLSLLAAVLLLLACPPIRWTFCSFICWVPIWSIIYNCRSKLVATLSGFSIGIIYLGVNSFEITDVAFYAHVMLVMLWAGFFAIFVAAGNFLQARLDFSISPIVVSAFWVSLEFLLSKLGYPVYFGALWSRLPFMAQIADLFGIYGITMVLILGQAYLSLLVVFLVSKQWRPALTAFLCVVCIAISYFFGAKFKKKTAKAVQVCFIKVHSGEFIASVPASGMLISKKVETILARYDGVVQDYGFKNAQIITKGALIADIVPFEETIKKKRQELEIARLDLKLIAQRLRQTELLVAGGAAATNDLETWRIQEYKQKLLIQDLEEELLPKPVVAPFTGMLIDKRFIAGGKISAGKELVTLAGIDDIVVELEISSYYIDRIQLGQQVVFQSEAFSRARNGRIYEVASLDPRSLINRPGNSSLRNAGLLAYATIEIEKGDYKKIGVALEVDVITKVRNNSISVPLEVVIFDGADKVVKVIKNGKVQNKIVAIGESNRNEIEITQGLSDGDSVITIGNLEVADGDAVRVQ